MNLMTDKFWKARATDSAAALIKWLLERSAQSGSGRSWPVGPGTDFAMLELGNSLVRPIAPFMVMRILSKMGSVKDNALSEFKAAHDEVVAEANATPAATKRWRFIFPIEMRLDATVPAALSVRLDGQAFTLLRHSELDEELSEAIMPSRLQAALHGERVDVNFDDALIIAERHAPTAAAALDRLYPAFDLFRGVLEYAVGVGEMRMLSTHQQPRSNVPHPKIVAAVSGTEYSVEQFDVADSRDTHRALTLRGAHLPRFTDLAEIFATPAPTSSTVNMIADGLRLYTQALDATWNYGCFVALWQLAELTTSATDVHGATDEVVKRLLWHTERWALPGAGLRETLAELGEKRNLIVHSGIHRVSEEEINTLKFICETTIDWLISSRTELPTRSHVRIVYRARSAPDAELIAQHAATDFIRRWRQR